MSDSKTKTMLLNSVLTDINRVYDNLCSLDIHISNISITDTTIYTIIVSLAIIRKQLSSAINSQYQSYEIEKHPRTK